MQEEQEEKKINNNWKIALAIVFSVAIITIILICVIKNITNVAQTNAAQQEQKNVEENIEEVVNLKDLTSVSNKTEEELKKLNEAEIKKEEKKQEKKETNSSKQKDKYYIKVNYKAQVVNVYTYDKNGKYTVPVKAFVCSTGTETPRSGVYRIPAKIVWCHMFGDVYAHYCSQIVGNILFHSVPYLEKRNDTLEYWAYDKLGTKASMGCIRLTTRDAKWIFDNVSCGTQVEFYASSNPGPLGKPTAQKISNAPGNLKNWDPTDPDPKNPWRTYKPENDKKEENVTQNNQTTNNETTNNEVTNNQTINNEVTNNQVTNNEITNNQTTNNEQQNNEVTNNQTTNNVQQNNEVENKENQNNELTNNQQHNNQGNNEQQPVNNLQRNNQEESDVSRNQV